MAKRRAVNRDVQQAAGCHAFVVTFVMPVLSIIVAAGALYNGAMLTIECERLAPKRTEEELVESGTITFPTQRVVDEGRVDVHITRKIIGLFPVNRVHLADVVDVDSTSSTTDVTDSTGRRTSSYTSGRLDLTTRDGRKWSSPDISHSVGYAAGEMEEKIQKVLDSNKLRRVAAWSIGLAGEHYWRAVHARGVAVRFAMGRAAARAACAVSVRRAGAAARSLAATD